MEKTMFFRITLILKGILLSLLLCNFSLAQDVTINTIQPVNATGNQCIDVEPVGDGFGWNGTCSCKLPSVYTDFGGALAADGDTLVIGAIEAPGGCELSGSASVYKFNADGSYENQGELVSSARTVGDGFAAYSFVIDISGDYIAVGTTSLRYPHFPNYHPDLAVVTVFERSGGSWSEKYVKSYSGTTAEFLIANDELFIIGDSPASIERYRLSDGVLLQTLTMPTDCSSRIWNFDVVHEFVAVSTSDNCTHVFEQSGSADFMPKWTLPDEYYLREINHETAGLVRTYSEVSDENRIYKLDTLVLNNDDQWALLNSLQRNHFLRYRIHNDQLFLFKNLSPTVDVYNFDSTNGWAPGQSVTPISYRNADLHFSGNTLAHTHGGGVGFFERDATGNWSQTSLNEFDDSTSGVTIRSYASQGHVAVKTTGIITGSDFWYNGPFALLTVSSETSSSESNACDYSDAVLYDGWGWDATTQQACPPLDTGGIGGTVSSGNDNNTDGTSEPDNGDTLSDSNNETTTDDNTHNGDSATGEVPGDNSEIQVGDNSVGTDGGASGGGKANLSLIVMLMFLLLIRLPVRRVSNYSV